MALLSFRGISTPSLPAQGEQRRSSYFNIPRGNFLALAFIVYATLSPIDARPVIAGPQFEHFAAFALMGLAFGLAYPNRLFLVVAIVVGSAFVLEALQLLTPDRHGRLLDALVKAAGGICGVGIAQLVPLFLRTQIDRTR